MASFNFTPVTTWVQGFVNETLLNNRVNALITELQNALTPAAPVNLGLAQGTGNPAGNSSIESGVAQAAADGRFGFAFGRISRSVMVPSAPVLIATLPAGIVPLARADAAAWGGAGNVVNVEARTDGGIYAAFVSGTQSTATVVRFGITFLV